MLIKLNYISRYNCIKKSDKKSLNSLTSLLSLKTLTKLANDATLSLQMINMYRKKRNKKQKNQLVYHDEQQDPTLTHNYDKDAKNVIQQVSQNIQITVDTNKQNSVQQKLSSSTPKNKLQNKTIQQANSIFKNKSHFKSPIQYTNNRSEQQSNDKYNQIEFIPSVNSFNLFSNKKIRTQQSIIKTQQLIIKRQQALKKRQQSLKKRQQALIKRQQQEKKREQVPIRRYQKQIKRYQKQTKRQQKQIKRQQKQIKRQQKQIKDQQMPIKQFLIKPQTKHLVNSSFIFNRLRSTQNQKKQFVQSVQDENQIISHPSVVIGRLNLGQQKQPKIVKQLIKECLDNHKVVKIKKHQKQKQQLDSKKNQIQKVQKQSQIQSYQKQQIKIHKPSKNLIQLELNHSQSQKYFPQQRSLQCQSPNKQFITIYFNQKQNQIILNQSLNQLVNQENDKILRKQDKIQIEQIKQIQVIDIKQGQNKKQIQIKQYQINNDKFQYLSQINPNQKTQQAPFQHPLSIPSSQYYQTILNQKQQIKYLNQAQKIQNMVFVPSKKACFKKLMNRKGLNPRLVTSTIVNDQFPPLNKEQNDIANLQNQWNLSPIKYLQNQPIKHNQFIKSNNNTIKQANQAIKPVNQAIKPAYQQKIQNQRIRINQVVKNTQQQKKRNFKKVIIQKSRQNKQIINVKPIILQAKIPLRKLQNQKKFQAFFNQN